MPRLGLGLGLSRFRSGSGGDAGAPSISVFSVGPQSGLNLPASITLIEGATAPTALYIVGVDAGSGTPSAAQIIAGQDSLGAAAGIVASVADAATGTESISITPTASGTYDFYAVAVDAGALESNIASDLGIEIVADTLPLDTLSANAAYSTRKLRTAYAGSAIRVRRSSDNTEQDIGFDVDGNLDTAALATFVGANSGFVVTWYDQTVNGLDLTNATTTNQPRLVNAGTNEALNTVPAPYFDGADWLIRSGVSLWGGDAYTFCFVHSLSAATASRTFFVERNTAGSALFRIRSGISTSDQMAIDAFNDANVGISPVPVLGSSVFNSTAKVTYVRGAAGSVRGFGNGTALDAAKSYTKSGVYTLNETRLGGGTSTGFIGHLAEMIIFDSSLSDTDVNTVGLSQGSAFGITVASL